MDEMNQAIAPPQNATQGTVNDLHQKIGEKEIGEALAIMRKYKDGKTALEQRIVDDELWWKMRHWEAIRNKTADCGKDTGPEPSSAWLFNTLLNKHADVMDNYPEPVVLPREQSDEESAKTLTSPLTEGVTPAGQSLTVTSATATVSQYGGYVTTSDVLDMTALDPVVNEATKLIARQAGETLDTITRDIVNAGTNVMYAMGKTSGTVNATAPTSRSALIYTSGVTNSNLTVDDIKRAVRALKRQDAPKINGDYVGIIHPDVAYDLMKDPEWLNPKQYVDTKDIYNGEIGKLYGVRFIENTRAKVFKATPLANGKGYLGRHGRRRRQAVRRSQRFRYLLQDRVAPFLFQTGPESRRSGRGNA